MQALISKTMVEGIQDEEAAQRIILVRTSMTPKARTRPKRPSKKLQSENIGQIFRSLALHCGYSLNEIGIICIVANQRNRCRAI